MHPRRCIKQVEYGYNTRKLHAGTAQAGYLRLRAIHVRQASMGRSSRRAHGASWCRQVNDGTSAPEVSDFQIDKYTFEVGGRKKGSKQVKDVENAYIVRDDTEYAAGEFLPLWSFGLMY